MTFEATNDIIIIVINVVVVFVGTKRTIDADHKFDQSSEESTLSLFLLAWSPVSNHKIIAQHESRIEEQKKGHFQYLFWDVPVWNWEIMVSLLIEVYPIWWKQDSEFSRFYVTLRKIIFYVFSTKKMNHEGLEDFKQLTENLHCRTVTNLSKLVIVSSKRRYYQTIYHRTNIHSSLTLTFFVKLMKQNLFKQLIFFVRTRRFMSVGGKFWYPTKILFRKSSEHLRKKFLFHYRKCLIKILMNFDLVENDMWTSSQNIENISRQEEMKKEEMKKEDKKKEDKKILHNEYCLIKWWNGTMYPPNLHISGIYGVISDDDGNLIKV